MNNPHAYHHISGADVLKQFHFTSLLVDFTCNMTVEWILLRGFFFFGRYVLAPEALTRARKARALAGLGACPSLPQEILQIKVLPSAISCILTSLLRWDAFSFNISFSESNFHSKKMFRNECVHLDNFQNTNIKITCRVDEWTRN